MNPANELFKHCTAEVDKAVIGKEQVKQIVFATFLARGNILLEGVPGIAKTLLARAVARALGLRFSRMQFTPDLMPSDIVGTSIYNQGKGAFEFVPGPIFSDFILADEINRAPAKTQAALLEAMEERQVTVDNATYPMSEHFIVFATQNPLEFEGTYALPEAQLDRFMVRIIIDYPSEHEEMRILNELTDGQHNPVERVETLADTVPRIREVEAFLKTVVVDERIVAYVHGLVRASRSIDELLLGSSPRAGQMLLRLSRAYAAVQGQDYVTPDHIRGLVPFVLPHRWIVKPAVEIQETPRESILRTLFDSVKVPVERGERA